MFNDFGEQRAPGRSVFMLRMAPGNGFRRGRSRVRRRAGPSSLG